MAASEDTALVVIREVVQMDLAVGLATVMAATEGAMDAMALETVVMATMEVIFVARNTSLMGMVVAMVQALEEGVQTVATVDVEGLAGVTAAGDSINFI